MDPTLLSASLAGASRGRLHLARGLARHITIRGGARSDLLYEGSFRQPVPEATVKEGEVRLEYRLLSSWVQRQEPAEILLNASIPWSIQLDGGAANAVFDLRALDVDTILVRGGLADADVHVDQRKRPVLLRVQGGVASLRVHRPATLPASLLVRGGGTMLQLDRQRLGAVGGETLLETPGYRGDAPRIDVEITGGAVRVEILTPS